MRKKAVLCALVAALLISSGTYKKIKPVMALTPVSETEALHEAVTLYENLTGSELSVPSELSVEGLSDDIVKSVMLGYINLEDAEDALQETTIRKQDFVSMLYKTVISFDQSYVIYGDEADAILNECYDNAYIEDKNRIPYAFMMKQGIITSSLVSRPDSSLTNEECELLSQRVYDFFAKNITLNIDGNDITIGANLNTVTDVFGEPNRIDKTEYGFDWYVYNSDYNRFFMVGASADRICAFFSNSSGFEFDSITSGDDFSLTGDYEDNRCFRFYPTPDGKVDSILYNSAYRGLDTSASIKRSKSMILLDMINANRCKNGKELYAENAEMSGDAWLTSIASPAAAEFDSSVTEQAGYDVFSVYRQLVEQDSDILTQETDGVTPVGISSYNDLSGGVRTSIVSDVSQSAEIEESATVALPENDYSINEVEYVTYPVLLSPQTEDEYNEGDDIVIELEQQAANKYRIEMFDVENDEYAVNEYLVTDETVFTLPHELFTPGRDYRIIVSSITDEGEALSADEVLISYGSIYEGGVEITAPYHDGILDDDELYISWNSEAYHDFYIDIYNEAGDLVVSKIVEDSHEALVYGLENGKYFLYVTALRRGTEVEKAQDYACFIAQMPEPVINEIILDKDETYYFKYEDEALGLLYFYDEEIVDVEENGKTVKKKKITQKQVKATRGYRQLASMRATPEYTTGDPSAVRPNISYDDSIGSAIVQEAEKYLDVPYVWGGTTPDGFDCSGLVQYVMSSLGISVNRVAEDQFQNGVSVSKDELAPGDLVFFEQNGYIHHVGIYAGDGMMIHAPHTGDVVKYQSIDTDYYRSEYAGARRVY